MTAPLARRSFITGLISLVAIMVLIALEPARIVISGDDIEMLPRPELGPRVSVRGDTNGTASGPIGPSSRCDFTKRTQICVFANGSLTMVDR